MKLIFSHIPKTAGTSVAALLPPLLPKGPKYFISDVGGKVSTTEFPTFALAQNWVYLGGHLNAETILKNASISHSDENIIFLSFLRDPIDRIMSIYNFAATNPKHPNHESFKNTDPITFALNHPENVQAKWLKAPSDVHVNWAIEIYVVSTMPKVCADIAERISGKRPQEAKFLEKRNVSSDRYGQFPGFRPARRRDLPTDLLNELKFRHRQDYRLLEEAEACGGLSGLL